MRGEAKRFGAWSGAAVSAAALLLAALALEGCAQSGSAPAGGETATQSLRVQPTPAQPAPPTPAVESPLPPPEGFVNDSANVIDDVAESLLEARLRSLKQRAKIEIGVATVETTGGQSISDYSLAVARGWGVGPPAGEEGGGLLLLIAVKDHQWRIQVSRGLEADLPDDVVADIGRTMTPSLREGRYGPGVTKCVDGLIRRLAERRGFSMKDETIILEGVPKAKPKA